MDLQEPLEREAEAVTAADVLVKVPDSSSSGREGGREEQKKKWGARIRRGRATQASAGEWLQSRGGTARAARQYLGSTTTSRGARKKRSQLPFEGATKTEPAESFALLVSPSLHDNSTMQVNKANE